MSAPPQASPPPLDQIDVFALIQAERAYQDAKWGALAEHPHEVGAWLLVMQGKFDAAVRGWQTTAGSHVLALTELVKAVAVGVACLQQHGGNLLTRLIRDMEFAQTNCGYMTPSRRSTCYWPVLEMIRDLMKQRVADPGCETRHPAEVASDAAPPEAR